MTKQKVLVMEDEPGIGDSLKKMFDYKKNSFPNAETISDQSLALPFYIGLTEKDVKYICSTVTKFV